jgi:hypothetical protein
MYGFSKSQVIDYECCYEVTLQGRAKASNIFWQVAGKAFGTTTHFEGYFVNDRITKQVLRSTEEL